MSLTENSDQVFLPGGCNRTQNLRFGPYTIGTNFIIVIVIQMKQDFANNYCVICLPFVQLPLARVKLGLSDA